MFNPFVMKKWAGLSMMMFLPTIGFYIGVTFYNLWIGLGSFFVAGTIAALAANAFLNNPFRAILEGKGVLALDISSTGIVRPFVCQVVQPFIKANLPEQKVKDVYDRENVYSVSAPIKAGKVTPKPKEDKIVWELSEETYNKARFAMFHWPVIIYNSQIRSFVTKDWLSDNEKSTFAEHGVLYLNRNLEEVTSIIRDFGRYIVEMTKPQDNMAWLRSKWTWVIIGIVVVVLVILFAPAIIDAIKGFTGSAGSAVTKGAGTALSNDPVVPQ